MKAQSFKMVKDNSNNILYRKVKKTKRTIFLFSAVLSMLLVISCKKSINELSSQDYVKAGLSSQSPGAAVTNSEETLSYDQTLFVPCANGGKGEEVALTGSVKVVDHIVYNDHGFTLNYNFIAQGVTGVGLSTGEKFQASFETKGTITGEFGEDGRYSRAFIQQLRIVGQKTVFKVQYRTKITITPDGKITTSIEDETVDCNM